MEFLLFLVKYEKSFTVLADGLLWDEARKHEDITDVAVCAVTIGAEDAAESELWGSVGSGLLAGGGKGSRAGRD